MPIYVGIDPGLTGAIAAIDHNGKVVMVKDLTTNLSGGKTAKVKMQISAAALRDDCHELMQKYDVVMAAVERVTAMPGQGVAGVFSLGDTYGCIRAVLAVLIVPSEFPTPAVWKRAMSLDSDKERSRAMAIQLFPDSVEFFRRKKDHNRAEALLLAEWLRRKMF
ncbi:MAG: hypothetical protein WAV01_02045 [Candidatus Saccharimonadales bacterium]